MLLTFFGNPWIHNVNVDQILVRLSPRSGEHASEVRTLAEIHFVQSPQFSTGADGNVRALLLLEQCLVDVLGGSQLLPAGIRTEIITLRDDVGDFTHFLGLLMLASRTSFSSSESEGLEERFRFLAIRPETESRAAPNGCWTWLMNCPILQQQLADATQKRN